MNENVSNQTIGYRADQTVVFTVSIPDVIQIVLFSLTIGLALAYTALIIVRPTFRQNKLNWFTVNICLYSASFCIIMLTMTILRVLNISDQFPCRFWGFLIDMAVCQLLYSHCIAAISRLLVVVYSTRRYFRSTSCTWIFIGSGSIVALLAASPHLFLDGFACSSTTQMQLILYYTFVATLLLPITLVAVCNCYILWFVRRSTRQVHTGTNRNRVSHARDIHLMKVLIGTFAVVVIGWSPVFILQTFSGSISVPRALDVCSQMLPALSMLLDVCLLIYTNQPVRLFLKQHILRNPQVAPANPTHVHPPNTNKY